MPSDVNNFSLPGAEPCCSVPSYGVAFQVGDKAGWRQLPCEEEQDKRKFILHRNAMLFIFGITSQISVSLFWVNTNSLRRYPKNDYTNQMVSYFIQIPAIYGNVRLY